MIQRLAFFIAIALCVFASPAANAGTSTFAQFPTQIFRTPATVTNAGNLFGNTPASATFNPSGGPTIALFNYGVDITHNTFTINVTSVAAPTQISVRFMNVGPGFTDTAPGSFPFASPIDVVLNISAPGAYTLQGSSFDGVCNGIGGCNSVLLNVTGAGSFSASVVSSAPEPSAWALMIVGFGGLAWRMKAMRKKTSVFMDAPRTA